ncbi:MAG: GspE/PulE family protein [Clostridia bacterium]
MLRINFITSLHSQNIITKEQLDSLSLYMKEQGANEMQAILQLGLLDNLQVAKAVANRYSLKFVNLRELQIQNQALIGLTADRLYSLGAFAFEVDEDKKTLKVAVVDPSDSSSIELLSVLTGKKITAYMALRSDINHAIDKRFNSSTQNSEYEAGTEIDVIELVQKWLSRAVRINASDIHIEGLPDKVRVRLRVDGVLRLFDQYPIEWMSSIVSRIKILSEMDIAERRMPQDGKFSVSIDKNDYDFRSSVIPTIFGEKCVLRIAPKRMVFSSKQQLGLFEEDLPKFERIFSKEHGMVLVTGPTGCGKTTTLYSVLSELNSVEKNTVTVEDPVEINISGINQVQASRRGGLGFSKALRSILRQDPDIIMIGEIRDTETAEMAIQASVTGHLVLSTLHTNSAATAINRLVNMGVEKYLVSDALTGIVSQRLVRKLCPHCKEKIALNSAQAKILDAKQDDSIYKSVGCEQCGFSGYVGRTSVFEILEINEPIRKMISSENFDTHNLQKFAVENGMCTLTQGAKRLVLAGVTSYEEALKIYADEDIL